MQVTDVVMDYCFGFNYDRTGAPNFDPKWNDAQIDSTLLYHFVKHFPWFLRLLKMIPEGLLVKLNPRASSSIQLSNVSLNRVKEGAMIANH